MTREPATQYIERYDFAFFLFAGKCFKVQKRHGPAPVSDSFPFRKHSPPNPTLAVKRSSTSSIVLQRPLRDRIIHLLALKPYRKPELILWLEREKANPKDKADLALVLDAVRLRVSFTYFAFYIKRFHHAINGLVFMTFFPARIFKSQKISNS